MYMPKVFVGTQKIREAKKLFFLFQGEKREMRKKIFFREIDVAVAPYLIGGWYFQNVPKNGDKPSREENVALGVLYSMSKFAFCVCGEKLAIFLL